MQLYWSKQKKTEAVNIDNIESVEEEGEDDDEGEGERGGNCSSFS